MGAEHGDIGRAPRPGARHRPMDAPPARPGGAASRFGMEKGARQSRATSRQVPGRAYHHPGAVTRAQAGARKQIGTPRP